MEIYKRKDVEDIVGDKVLEATKKETKEKFDLLLEVLDRRYLTEDSSCNDIFLRDDVVKAMEEILDGSYKEHNTCYNCKRDGKCKFINKCKNAYPSTLSPNSYFEKKY